jgi:hypothetical protein
MSRIALCLLCLLAVLVPTDASAQGVTGITLQGPTAVSSANDFATNTFQDPWDMNERTDFGWWLNSVDTPRHGFASSTFAGGLFTGVVDGDPNTDPNLWLLETNTNNLARTGKNGSAFPLNASVYRVFAMRMRVSQPGTMNFLWSTGTIYDPPGLQPSQGVFTTAGWHIYIMDLATMGVGGFEGWSGIKRSLRLDPAPDAAPAGSTVEIDWVRLVDNQPSLFRTISWNNPGGPVDIYLDNDNSATSDPNQTLGLVAQNVSGTSFALNVGALQPGTYYVAMRRTGTSNTFSYSSTFFQVNAPATITVTSPSDEGSSDDFATTHLNNPWDMTSLSDVDHVINLQPGYGIVAVPGAETEAGAGLGSITTFSAISALGDFSNPAPCAQFAKPVVFPLHRDVRGAVHRIDPTRYRILTAELGIPNKARDLCGGSIVRLVWHVAGEGFESYSWGITLNSRAGANVVNRINVDMADRATLPIDPASPSQAGWVPGATSNPGIMSLRIDPHEFANPTPFYIKRLKLAALETAHTNYTVRWTSSKTAGSINVYYDVDKDPSSKTLIGTVAGSATSIAWNTTNLPQDARYFVYVEFNDGFNLNGAYSKWPIEIDHSPTSTARLVPNRSTLNFGVTAQTVMTPAQTIRLNTLNGSPCWTASSELPFLVVSPSTGCGAAVLTVSLVNQPYSGQTDYSGYIRITSTQAINSPQLVRTVVRVRVASSPPGGFVDTPANGTAVSGSLAVTGWAIDDIGIARVTICRDPVGAEQASPACGPNQIYIGDGVMIDDSRPDVEAASPNSPLNYRAGWGHLILTNMMPNQGNGPFNLRVHAWDIEGRRTEIGSRVIFAQNATAQEPFGAIDTPAQGAVISGSNYANFGWVLSRVRRADPPGGGHVTVYIDGLPVGIPGGWNRRADLSALFPGYPGIDTALGVFGINTTQYANGLHTIAWVVTDNGGVTSGIGSRYFSIFNAGALTLASANRPAGPDLGKRLEDLGGSESQDPIALRQGFRAAEPLGRVAANVDGSRHIWATERDRVEIRMNPAGAAGLATNDEYAAYLLVNGRLKELPNGSSFDPARGAFYWQPGLGHIGDYDFVFVRTGAEGSRERIPVRVTLQARKSTTLASLRSPWARVDFLR